MGQSDFETAEPSSRLVQLLSRCIVPIYHKSERSIPAHVGTGFLVRGKTGLFLVSAGHVLQNLRTHQLFVYISETITLNISGRYVLSSVGIHDKLDLGVVKLRCGLRYFGDSAKMALPINCLVGNALPRDEKDYLLIGVPETKSRFRRRNSSIIANYCPFLTQSASCDKYEQLRVSPFSHIVLAYNWKRCYTLQGSKTDFPKIDGMSGCPLFLFEDKRDVFDSTNNFIVGVLIEYHFSKQCLLATDVRYALEIIRRLDR